jgi:hypothetical protein
MYVHAGIGSQGDGAVQLLCGSKEEQTQVYTTTTTTTTTTTSIYLYVSSH